MTFQTPIKRKNQKGDMLLEALISVVLMAIVAMGITFALSKVAVNMRDTKSHIVVVNQMRELLLNTSREDLCNNNVTISVAGNPEIVSVNNCTNKVEVKLANAGTGVYVDAPLVLEYGDYKVGALPDTPVIATVKETVNDVSDEVEDRLNTDGIDPTTSGGI